MASETTAPPPEDQEGLEGPERLLLGRPALLLLGAALLGLLPWMGYLALALPVTHRTPHWDALWVGFDTFLVGALAATIVALKRRSPYLPLAATALGTLLLADAWFDTMTARPGGELYESLGWLALELPLAAFAFLLARAAVASPQRVSAMVAQVERGRRRSR